MGKKVEWYRKKGFTDDIVVNTHSDLIKMNNIFALLTIAITYITTYLFWKVLTLNGSFIDSEWKAHLATLILAIIQMGVVFFLVIIRSEKVESIGFTKKNLGKSVILGIVVSMIFCTITIFLNKVRFGSVEGRILDIVYRLFYCLICIGLPEEVLYRGYIGTRFFYKKRWISIVFVGIIFVLLHIPARMATQQIGFFEALFSMNIISMVLGHCLFQWMFSKYNNIAGPVILHMFWDLLYWCIENLSIS